MNHQHKQHIDQLLKESFENFQPQAPDVWSAIGQQIGNATANAAGQSAQVSSNLASGSIGIGAKIAVAIATVSAVAGITYYVVSTSTIKTDNTPHQIETDIDAITPIEEPVLENPNEPSTTNAINTSAVKPNQTKQRLMDESPATEAVHTSKEHSVSGHSAVSSNQNEEKHTSNIPVSGQTVVSSAPTKQNYNVPIPDKKEVLGKVANQESNGQNIFDAEEPILNIPNAFTPNNDGLNDEFVVEMPTPETFVIRILNRQGQTVFETTDYRQHWNGRLMQTGDECEPGEYIYTLRFRVKGGSEQVKSGKIVLIR